jgi:hypothetical protein
LVLINQLDIADGLKELLLSHGFTLELVLSMTSNDLAEIVGIDKCIAMIIKDAAKRIRNDINQPTSMCRYLISTTSFIIFDRINISSIHS